MTDKFSWTRRVAALLLAGAILGGCGGGGGGDRAPGIKPGPEDPGGSVPPPDPPRPGSTATPYAEVEELFATITAADIGEDGRAAVDFQLTDGVSNAIADLEAGDVRFVIAKLQPSPDGSTSGDWQSYINRIEQPGVGPGTMQRLQATAERGGEFTNNGDGSYRYVFTTAVDDLADDVLAQAEAEGLDLAYDASLTHRVVIQFDNGGDTANPHYDWVPATGDRDGIPRRQISATDSCNRCHDKLSFHGGGRTEVEYCVVCHNPGTTDANSTNSADMKVMIHKLHMGVELPSVQDGEPYQFYGFRDTLYDYSGLRYPQDHRYCVNCHAGTGTGADNDGLILTDDGDAWAEYPSRASCGSCHDRLDFSRHAGGQPDDSRCASCHSLEGFAGSVVASHRIDSEEAREAFYAEILDVVMSSPGEQPMVTVRVSNPETGEAYDLANDDPWTNDESSLNVRMAWDTREYTNAGNGGNNASSVGTSALGVPGNGDGSYTVTLPVAVPDGSEAPGIAASGSGVITIEGHPGVDYDDDGEPEPVPVGDVHRYFSINEPDGAPVARREPTELSRCLTCHGSLVFHGNNRADNLMSCATCHNPRNTDRRVREVAIRPPTDGKEEESLNFTTMVHGIHAAAMREEPLQLVGFRGFSTYVYDEKMVHYPGNLGNCQACHVEGGYELQLAPGVLGTTIDTGEDRQDPRDDLVVSPATAACSSCHDSAVARAHMESNGGSFATVQPALDGGEVIEQCSVCHGPGRSADTALVHPIRDLP